MNGRLGARRRQHEFEVGPEVREKILNLHFKYDVPALHIAERLSLYRSVVRRVIKEHKEQKNDAVS